MFSLLGTEINSVRKMAQEGADRTSVAVLASVCTVSLVSVIAVVVISRREIAKEKRAHEVNDALELVPRTQVQSG